MRMHLSDGADLFGEGGAGTFSDGKLTCRMSGPDVDWVLARARVTHVPVSFEELMAPPKG